MNIRGHNMLRTHVSRHFVFALGNLLKTLAAGCVIAREIPTRDAFNNVAISKENTGLNLFDSEADEFCLHETPGLRLKV